MTTTDRLFFVLKFCTALGCGLTAGVFFAFSSFVMSGLARLHPAQGIAAMQSINITVIPSAFMGVFLGTALTCSLLAVSALLHRHLPGAMFLIFGSLLYLAGTFLVTLVFNVPLNDLLAAVEPGSAQSGSLWRSYLSSWLFWNHIRTLAALAAAILLTVTLRR